MESDQRRFGTSPSDIDIRLSLGLIEALFLSITQKQSSFTPVQSILMNRIDSCGPKATDGSNMSNMAMTGLSNIQKSAASHIATIGEAKAKKLAIEYTDIWESATKNCPPDSEPVNYATTELIDKILSNINNKRTQHQPQTTG